MRKLPRHLMIFTVVGSLGLTVAAPVWADDAPRVKIAKMGANLAGYNYQNYEYCGAGSADLVAIKAKDHEKFAAAGNEFDSSFAAGVADSVSKRNLGIAQLGEAKYKASVCPFTLNELRAKLVRK